MNHRTLHGRAKQPESPFPVEIIRSSRRVKTISVQVREGRVVVRAPLDVPERSIEKILREKRPQIEQWMVRDLVKTVSPWHDRPLLVAGTARQLHFHTGLTWSFVLTRHDLHITGPAPSLSDEQVKIALINWLQQAAEEDLNQRVRFWAQQLGVKYGKIRIKNQQSRWGSCSQKGNINLNWRLVITPQSVADYVVVHELCHRLEMNHSPAFWRHVARWLPDYRSARTWLKDQGQTLYF